ncbi:MAG TPA: LytTR family DNA-binding domain-containing protein [Candidatus Acidoferrales bacterium]|nr:LytTR family DNA-binding domain-containing protein [Candidatus Acidoferrales bacterium]
MDTTANRSARPQKSGPRKIALKTEGKTVFVDPAEVSVIEGRGNYVQLQTPVRSYLVRESVSNVASKLERYGFVRIHRSTIINASLVEESRTSPSGEARVRLKGGAKEYNVSKKYKSALKPLATCWI